MINTAFASMFAILRQIITWLGSVWSAVGDFQPIFIAIFTGFIVFNLFIRPLLGFSSLASNFEHIRSASGSEGSTSNKSSGAYSTKHFTFNSKTGGWDLKK